MSDDEASLSSADEFDREPSVEYELCKPPRRAGTWFNGGGREDLLGVAGGVIGAARRGAPVGVDGDGVLSSSDTAREAMSAIDAVLKHK